MIPPETIDQITAANDIVEVVQGYIPLKRAGAVWKTTCPFHQERTASFSVNPQRQIFKCFGCGAGGTAIKFVMLYENLDFVSAAKKLAERAGIRIVEGEMSEEDQRRYGMRRRLLALHADAAQFFHHQLLRKPSAETARNYLKTRGVTGDIAKAWQLGYAPEGWESMSELAHQHGFSEEELIESGLVKLRDDERRDGDFYDRFRDRVMFPICDDNSQVIAFSGRVLAPDAKAAKYVNSPETMLFSKGAVLFGLHKSKRALIDAKSAIVCEGQLDLITAFEAGVQNVVAPQGTAFTPKQARRLKQFVEEVILCFDSDAAGEKAAERSLPHLLHESILVRVAQMPEGEDPDSMIRGRGADAFRERITAAPDYFDFQLGRLSLREDFTTPRGKVAAARRLADSVSLISDTALREAVMHRVSQRLEISTGEFVRLLKQPSTSRASEETVQPSTPAVELDPTLELLIKVALTDRDARQWIKEQPWREVLAAEDSSGLAAVILEPDFDPADPKALPALLAQLEQHGGANVVELIDGKTLEFPMTVAFDCWRELERREIRRRLDRAHARLKTPNLSEDEVGNLQKEVLDQQKRLSDIARPLSPPI